MTYKIRTSGLVKRYGDLVALNGLDLEVPQGQVLGLLGPNGAGKTTAVRILTTLLEPDEGEVEVAGLNVRTQPEKVRERIGLSGQSAAIDEHLSGFENLDMVGRMYHLGRKGSRARARQLLESFSLTEAADRPAKTYSGGMRRRLDLAAALVAEPEVLFLDEPTTGLDPRSRSQMWETIQDLVRGGSTVLLTTQYMEEADRLADDIVVIDKGQKIAQGTASELKRQIGGERVEVVLAHARDLATARSVLTAFAVDGVQVDEQACQLTAGVARGADDLRRVLQAFADYKVGLVDVGLRRPTLDDVFLSLTGHGTVEQATNGNVDGDGTAPAKAASARKKEAVR
ncbi:MAG TPA: ATP-binding cassette domain-containing protein [Actinomycetota bacterium]|nr:ATP-binding cassette domain-containing protein [Actinomycetota bacterium]